LFLAAGKYFGFGEEISSFGRPNGMAYSIRKVEGYSGMVIDLGGGGVNGINIRESSFVLSCLWVS
jgi:hypothetical protein